MLVICNKYSTRYPTGVQRKNDIILITKEQAQLFESMGMVKILPEKLQPRIRRGRTNKISTENSGVKDLSRGKGILFNRKY